MWKNLASSGIVGAGLLAARRYYRNWGTTKEECATQLPGDEWIPEPAVQSTEGIWIDAPASMVWPWLAQMGQDRGGLYTYEKLQSLLGGRHHDADRIHPEWQHLEIGDLIRIAPRGWMGLRDGIALRVSQILHGQSIVLRMQPPDLPWDGIWSFHVFDRWEDRCRLLVRTRSRTRTPAEALGAEAAGPVLALMTRGMLLGIKERAERAWQAAG